ncbi:UDP-Glycosyltransferase/glycogen phosphorylase [Pilatotrama ljubarskyi]|nr:UDP-Glycosyltransferase/glycogen phosphorylase [Pilatotrama ljubarskyi]
MTASPAQPEGHIVLLGNGPWADAKQLCIFGTRIVKLRPVHVTIFTTEAFLERARREVSSELATIALPSERHRHFVDPAFEVAFAKAYRQLLAGEAVQCAATGERFSHLPLPQAIVTHNSTLESLRRLKAESSAPVKLFVWYAHVPSALFFFHGPAERGGIGDVRARVQAEAQRRGAPAEEVFEEIVSFLSSTLIRIPGYEPIYSHEVQPQELSYHGTFGLEWLTTYDMFTACDGVLMSTPECFDPLSIIATRAWMAETGRGAYAVGPIISSGAQAVENEILEADKGTDIRDFISRVMKSHGPKSLLYISFGSWIWPKYPESLWTFLDVVMDLGIPFILSHASELAEVPEEVKERVDRYRLGMLSTWCPQQMILHHPVTAWFLTHCGHKSVMEAISAGVPMICWPFIGDGPLNAIHLTDTLKCAYELLEVRTGHGLERIYRTGARAVGTPAAIRAEALRVLESAFGEDGERKRANVLKMRARFEQAWRGDGESARAAEAFVEELGL